ncbi:MAG: hypothetical protein AAB599_02005 [Patescibacteria group bacterium]
MLENPYKDSPELRADVEDQISLFVNNPDDTRLLNHKLTKRLKSRWAFSITDDIRIIYKWQGKNTAQFLSIGTHPQVYTRKPKVKKN